MKGRPCRISDPLEHFPILVGRRKCSKQQEMRTDGLIQSDRSPLWNSADLTSVVERSEAMDIFIALLILGASALLIVAPSVCVWRALSRPVAASPAWLGIVFALIGPFIAVFAICVLIWLPAYAGQCGGWLGETLPCSGFGQFLFETMFWAAMGMAIPGLLGMLLGIAVLIGLLVRRGMKRPAI
ncbi:MAG: hypothetical protein IOB85_06460 [Methylobacterium sp.]|nr:hypothetical protein [Methylobacterium sp.]MCA3657878.1 hypothetical protein [Methylobacterium sp.]MCA3670260.1 hypothetical protein [Methylobacterium sp.]MCA3675631.1 hypothetical protein [Methylobacterium sp.]MCA3678746.1 hypothetical protein [Methylobacterium sp.]